MALIFPFPPFFSDETSPALFVLFSIFVFIIVFYYLSSLRATSHRLQPEVSCLFKLGPRVIQNGTNTLRRKCSI